MKQHIKHIVVLCVALALLAGALLLVSQLVNLEPEQLAAQLKNSPAVLPFLFFLYLLKAVTVFFLPQVLVYLLTGLLFSPWLAFLITLVFLTMEFSADYLLGRTFGKKWLDKLSDKLENTQKLGFLSRLLRSEGLDRFSSIFILRAMPGISTDAVSLLAGCKSIRFGPYLLASLGGAAPKAIAVTLMGSAVTDPLSPAFLISAALLAAIVAVSVLVKQKLSRSEKAKKAPTDR